MQPGRPKILRPEYSTAAFLGVGTGRCGTLSLAKILSECGGVDCTHEAYHTTPGLTLDVCEMLMRLEPENNAGLRGQIGAG